MNIQSMSLRQKIGQMFMCGFKSTEPTSGIEQLIRDYHLGGIIYFRRNLQTPGQVGCLSAKLQTMAADAGQSELPLLIAIDQEGGMVTRIEQGIALMPGNMSLGASRDVEAAYETAYISGRELRAMGMNVNFAPDVDVNNNPHNPVIGVRSYGELPHLVAQMGAAAVRGYEAAGVAATIKHFPGHGDTASDSHYDLPLVPHDLERLQAIELVPFKHAIEQGVDMVMSAHVIFPAIEDGGLPSTLSPKAIDGFLRAELGYEGVVTTDCMEMKAIADHYGVANGTVLAVEAGIDIVLISHTIEQQKAGIEALVQAVVTGRISEERIDRSVERILRLKRKLKAAGEKPVGLDQVGLPASIEVAERLFEKSVTLVKNEGQIPLSPGLTTLVIWAEPRENTEVVEIIAQDETLGYYLQQSNRKVNEIRVSLSPSESEVEEALKTANGYDQVVLVTYNAAFYEGQIRIAEYLAQNCAHFVVVAARNPFDYLKFPNVKGYIAAYENRPLAMKAVAKVLTGELKPSGKLPVTLTEAYLYGWSV